MNRLLILFIIILINSISFSKNNCDIVELYPQLFKIEKQQFGKNEYLVKTVQNVDTTSCFAKLVNNNQGYFNYLLTHFSDRSIYEQLMTISDSVELQHTFIRSLQADSLFNKEMNEVASHYKNPKINLPDTVSVNQLLNIAVKYFSVLKINEEGYYIGKVCTGINSIKETEKERQPHVEAFCFTTIFDNYQGKTYHMYNEFVKGLKELYTLNLGIEKEERLLRAQGAMYMFMRNNEKLRALLLQEYDIKKMYLPFFLKVD